MSKVRKRKREVVEVSRNFVFHQPFTMIIAGPTMSGKTCFIRNVLAAPGLISPPPSRVYWCYGIENKEQENLISASCLYPIEFCEGLINFEDIPEKSNCLVILDDLMQETASSRQICDIFTRGAHHKEISVVLLVQNLYFKGKHSRDININATYYILMKNPRSHDQIKALAYQAYYDNQLYFVDAYNQATRLPHSYLVVDFSQQTSDDRRLSTNILPGQVFYYFVPKIVPWRFKK